MRLVPKRNTIQTQANTRLLPNLLSSQLYDTPRLMHTIPTLRPDRKACLLHLSCYRLASCLQPTMRCAKYASLHGGATLPPPKTNSTTTLYTTLYLSFETPVTSHAIIQSRSFSHSPSLTPETSHSLFPPHSLFPVLPYCHRSVTLA